jgi:signal transduction histidine kinase/CheY-like chemotaxis protein
LKATVIRTFPGGLLVETEEGEGFIPRRELSWERTSTNPVEAYRAGDQIDVAPYGSADGGRRLRFSARRALYDPWERHGEKYWRSVRRGIFPVVHGVVQDVTPTCIYISLDDHNDAVLFRSGLFESLQNQGQDLGRLFSIGDHVEGRIKDVLHDQKSLVLDIAGHAESLAFDCRKESGWSGHQSFGTLGSTNPLLAAAGLIQPARHDFMSERIAGMRILGVEDDDLDRQRLQRILDSLGCTKELPTTLEGLHAVLAGPGYFDLLLIDKNLDKWQSGLKGIDLVALARRYHPGLPVVAFSHEDVPNIRDAFAGLAEIECFSKPYKLEPIEFALEKQVGRVSGSSLGYIRKMDESVRETRRFLSSDRDVDERLQFLLKVLCKKAEGLLAAVLRMDLIDHEVTCISSLGLESLPWSAHRSTLRHTPIADVILYDEPILHSQLPVNRKKHFPPQLSFVSFAGIPIETFGQICHGLFLFGPTKHTITDQVYAVANDSVFVIARVIERSLMDHVLVEEALFASMGRLYMSMGHEIRDAVTGIHKIPAEVRRDLEKLQAEQKGQVIDQIMRTALAGLKKFEEAGKRILKLFDFYADLSPHKEHYLVTFCVRDVIEELIGEMRGRQCSAEILFTVAVESSLTIINSKIKFQQILKNLILNACQQMSDFHPPVSAVWVSSEVDEADTERPVKILVRDSGPGIHAGEWERVFEPFKSTRKKGAGLGLYLCRMLARYMGGRIRVHESYMFVGTSFLLELPLQWRASK